MKNREPFLKKSELSFNKPTAKI